MSTAHERNPLRADIQSFRKREFDGNLERGDHELGSGDIRRRRTSAIEADIRRQQPAGSVGQQCQHYGEGDDQL